MSRATRRAAREQLVKVTYEQALRHITAGVDAKLDGDMTKGDAALERAFQDDPATYLRTIYSLLPKQIDAEIGVWADMDLDQLAQAKTFVRDQFLKSEPPMKLIEAQKVEKK
jgi:hypothetical protein